MALLFASTIAGVVAATKGIDKISEGAEKKALADYIMKQNERFYAGDKAKLDMHVMTVEENIKELDRKELEILSSFDSFADSMEKIQGRPKFKEIIPQNVSLPDLAVEELRTVSNGANSLLNSVGAAFGGMALGMTVLGAAPFGIGMLIGGYFYNKSANKRLDMAYVGLDKAMRIHNQIEEICEYLEELKYVSDEFLATLLIVQQKYLCNLKELERIVAAKTEWNDFSLQEKLVTQNTILLVGILFKMCQTSLIKKDKKAIKINKVDSKNVKKVISECNHIIDAEVKEVELNFADVPESVAGIQDVKVVKEKAKIQNNEIKEQIENIKKDIGNMIELFMPFVFIDLTEFDLFGEEYSSKGLCTSAAEKNLKKKYNLISNLIDSSSKKSLACKIEKETADHFEMYYKKITNKITEIDFPDYYEEEKNTLLSILDYSKTGDIIENGLKDILKNEIPKKVGSINKYISRIEYSNAFDGWEYILPSELSDDYVYMENEFIKAAEKYVKKIMQERVANPIIEIFNSMV